MKALLCTLALGVCPAAAIAQASPAPVGAAFASLAVPGLGQVLYRDYTTAAEHFGIFAVSLGAGLHYQHKPDFLSDDDRYSQSDREFINQTTLRRDFALRIATDTALYSSFSAYREGRQRDTRSYRTPAPTERLSDLALAPFSWQYLSRPTTFIPLAIQALAAARGGYGIYRSPDVSQRDLHVYNFTANEFTAVGEEGFFRGFLNNDLSSRWGNGWGLAASSTAFGLAHYGGKGDTASPIEAGLAGAYLGWVHQRNGFQIGEGVAIHYWINVLAGISAIRHGGSAQLLTIALPLD